MELRASRTASFAPVLILIAVAVFGGSAFAGTSEVTGAQSVSATPTLDITGMTFVSSTTHEAEVVVHAERAQYRPDADLVDLTEVRASVATGSEGRKLEIECDEGTLNLTSNSFWARGNVKGRTEDGRRFSAPWVRYDHAEALLFTDAPVLLTESGTTLRGGGFRYFVNEERFRLLGGATVVQD